VTGWITGVLCTSRCSSSRSLEPGVNHSQRIETYQVWCPPNQGQATAAPNQTPHLRGPSLVLDAKKQATRDSLVDLTAPSR
jgi:hypothetical protein